MIKNRAPISGPGKTLSFQKRRTQEPCSSKEQLHPKDTRNPEAFTPKRRYMRCGEEMPKMPNVVDMTIRVASHRAKRAFLRFSSSTLSTGQFV